MDIKYDNNAKIFKALSDSNRLQIIHMLSFGEKCACKILDHFEFTQPTLSHHMKVLIECGLVEVRKEGTWNYYSLNEKNSLDLMNFLEDIILLKKDRLNIEDDECNC